MAEWFDSIISPASASEGPSLLGFCLALAISLAASAFVAVLYERFYSNRVSGSEITAVQISWAEQRRLLKTREKASPKGCSGDQVAALDKIEIMLLSQLGLHSRQ